MVRFALAAVAALAACESPAPAPDAPVSAWRLGPAMPRRALEPGVAAFGQRVVVAGGFDTGVTEADITARVDAFDTTTERWESLPDAPVRWTSSNVAAVGATLYLVGGLEGAARVARGDGFALDPLTQIWQPIAALDPADARGGAGVVAGPARIYLLGGASSTGPLASCLEYDLIADRWEPLPALPAPRAHPAAMRRADGTLFVAGGFESLDASAPRNDVWSLPPPGAVPREWQPRAAMQTDAHRDSRGGCAYGVALGNLVCAGLEEAGARDVVEAYEPYLDTWVTGEAMPVERPGTQGAAVANRLYVPGGADAGAPSDTLYIYAPIDTAPR